MDVKKVLAELYSEKARVEQAIAALESLNISVASQRLPALVAPVVRQAAATRGGRRMSAAARKRISEAAKKRWAARKAGTPAGSPAKKSGKTAAPTAPARHMSAAARKRISAAAKRRWAARRAAAK